MDGKCNRLIVLLAPLLIVVGCYDTRDHPQQENGHSDSPGVPTHTEFAETRPRGGEVEIKEILESEATFVSQKDNRFVVSFVLKNRGATRAVVNLGPQTGEMDGANVTLSQPGIALAASTNGDLQVVDDQLRLGAGWVGVIAISPGEQIERTIEFEVTDTGRSLLRTGASAFLMLQGYEGPPATVSGRIAIPITSVADNVR